MLIFLWDRALVMAQLTLPDGFDLVTFASDREPEFWLALDQKPIWKTT